MAEQLKMLVDRAQHAVKRLTLIIYVGLVRAQCRSSTLISLGTSTFNPFIAPQPGVRRCERTAGLPLQAHLHHTVQVGTL